MASVLIIGVGSTGLSVLEQAQQFHYEFTKKNSPGSNAAFLYIETATSNPATTPNGTTDIKNCNVSFNNTKATLTGWQKANNKEWDKWLPSNADVLNAHTGAGGQPVLGRVALWANETIVSEQIISSYKAIGGNNKTNIYIVGSLTGGTGTGMFIDLAYLIRSCTGVENIYGMFLLPNKHDIGSVTYATLYENAYSSLRSLDHFAKANVEKNSNYNCTLPSGRNISNGSAPFYNIQFFSQDFSNANASMTSLSDLIRSVGFNLVLRILDITNQQAPFQDLINARLVDYTAKVPNGLNTTIGFNMFQYPEPILEEYLAIDLIQNELLNRWSDNVNYIDTNGVNQPVKSAAPKIKNEMAKHLENTIDDAIEKCMGNTILGSTTLKKAVEKEIEIIKSGNFQAPNKRVYIYNLFSDYSANANFYAAIHGQDYNLRDYIIESIAEKINKDSTTYQNLAIIELELSSLATAIDNLITDWSKRLLIDGTPQTWKNTWEKNIKNTFNSELIYKTMLCKDQFLESNIYDIAKLCYYNACIPMLKKISDSITGINSVNSITTNHNKITLPTLSNLHSILNTVNALLNKQANDSIVTRKNNIQGHLDQTSPHPQIHFLYNDTTFENDIKTAISKYNNLGNKLKYSTISKDDLWNYLYNKKTIEIRADLIKNGLTFIQGLKLFADTDIVDIMCKVPQNHLLFNKINSLLNNTEAVIMGDVPAMTHLISTEQFMTHQCLKLIIVSAQSENDSNGVINKMKINPSNSDSSYVQLPSLKNTVVVYQEYGYMGNVNETDKTFNPLLHLSYQPQILGALKKKVEQGNNVFNSKMRLAYIDTDTLIDTNKIKIK